MDNDARGRRFNAAVGSRWPIFGPILVLAATVGLVSPAVAQTRSGPKITFRLYNYAHVAPALLAESERQATMIFARAGVYTSWVDCPRSKQESARYPACSADTRPTDVEVRILSPRMSRGFGRLPVLDAALGFAIPTSGQAGLGFVNVLYDHVEEVAQVENASIGQILGGVIGHEVGHLLLGPRAHSAAGIMRAHWTAMDLTLASQSYLAFPPQQAEHLRAELLARTEFRDSSLSGK